jgi:hypothetical protein
MQPGNVGGQFQNARIVDVVDHEPAAHVLEMRTETLYRVRAQAPAMRAAATCARSSGTRTGNAVNLFVV